MPSTQTRMQAVLRWMRAEDDPLRLPSRLFWVGLALRVAYITLAHTYKIRLILDHFQFGWEMGRIARSLATGYGFANPFNGHSGPTAWTPPLYPLLLAGVFKVFGVYTLKSAWVILTINSIFSAATGCAVYEIAWRCFGRDAKGLKVALWSGWLWALYPAAMQYAVHWVWDMALTALLFSWVLVLALRVRAVGDPTETNPQSARRWLLFGVLWGVIALSNSSLLTFLPACGLWMVWPELTGLPRHVLRALRNAVLAAVCCLAMLAPWVARNWYTFHAFIPMRANLGAELYQSVLQTNDGFPWGGTLSLAEADPEFQRYEHMGEVAFSKAQGERAKEIIRRDPRTFARHAALRVFFFWVSVPHPVEKSVFIEATREANYAFLSLAGLLGLALALHRRVPGAWLFFWAFALFPLIYYFITVQARFRHPLEPIITVLAVYLFQSAELPSEKRRRLAEAHA
ncbi:ArnT family glycosyltransferase [Granulicella tundricola]|nr:glycosyltransferase family 39 protein [Granulicella tundricola]